MFTRLILRKPFQVARAAISLRYRYAAETGLGLGASRRPLAPSQIQPRARELRRPLADLVAQQAARRAVFVPGHRQPPRKAPQARDHDERGMVLPFAPADPSDVGIRD